MYNTLYHQNTSKSVLQRYSKIRASDHRVKMTHFRSLSSHFALKKHEDTTRYNTLHYASYEKKQKDIKRSTSGLYTQALQKVPTIVEI